MPVAHWQAKQRVQIQSHEPQPIPPWDRYVSACVLYVTRKQLGAPGLVRSPPHGLVATQRNISFVKLACVGPRFATCPVTVLCCLGMLSRHSQNEHVARLVKYEASDKHAGTLDYADCERVYSCRQMLQ